MTRRRKSALKAFRQFFAGEPNISGKSLVEIFEQMGAAKKTPEEWVEWLQRYGREHGREVPDARELALPTWTPKDQQIFDGVQENARLLKAYLDAYFESDRLKRLEPDALKWRTHARRSGDRGAEYFTKKQRRNQRIWERWSLEFKKTGKLRGLPKKVRESFDGEPGERINLSDKQFGNIMDLDPKYKELKRKLSP